MPPIEIPRAHIPRDAAIGFSSLLFSRRAGDFFYASPCGQYFWLTLIFTRRRRRRHDDFARLSAFTSPATSFFLKII